MEPEQKVEQKEEVEVEVEDNLDQIVNGFRKWLTEKQEQL